MGVEPRDFDYVRQLVREVSAIEVEATKQYLVESRLEPLVRALAEVGSIAELVAKLRATPFGPLHLRVVDAMTTNETSFFRDVQPFETLKLDVLPRILERRAAKKELSIWCAACSSGQEPYTIAMVLRESFPQLRDWKVRILATDLSPTMVEKARAGRFSQLEVNRGLPAPLLVKYFRRDGLVWQINEDLRSLIEVQEFNLVKPWPRLPDQDIVFLRNVLIYFNVEVKREILQRMGKVLRPDGYLFLGAAETTLNLDEGFERLARDRSGCFLRKAA